MFHFPTKPIFSTFWSETSACAEPNTDYESINQTIHSFVLKEESTLALECKFSKTAVNMGTSALKKKNGWIKKMERKVEPLRTSALQMPPCFAGDLRCVRDRIP